MYQLGKEVGKAAQKEMKLTNVEVTHAKVILQKSSKQWNLHQTVKDMYELDNEVEAVAPEEDPSFEVEGVAPGDQGEASSSQKIPVSKHHLKKWLFAQRRHVEATKKTWLKKCDERCF